MCVSNNNTKGLKHLTLEELRELIDSLVTDIEFEYNGKCGAICPINRKHIDVGFGDYRIPGDYTEALCLSVEETLTTKFIDGKSLTELCDEIKFDF